MENVLVVPFQYDCGSHSLDSHIFIQLSVKEKLIKKTRTEVVTIYFIFNNCMIMNNKSLLNIYAKPHFKCETLVISLSNTNSED